MTLKHIDADGRENTVSLVSVSFDPESGIVTGRGIPSEASWSSGRVFVMNDQGKTVANYNLDKKEQHHG